MLSSHSTCRDQYGIPIIDHCSRRGPTNGFKERELEYKERNRVHKSLRVVVNNVRNVQDNIDFTQDWLLRYLKPISHPLIQQQTKTVIDSLQASR